MQLKLNRQSAGIKVNTFLVLIIPIFNFNPLPLLYFSPGRAAIYILRTAFGVDWSERIKIIYAGDDMTDEEAMTVS